MVQVIIMITLVEILIISYFSVNFMAKNEHCLYFIIIYQSEIKLHFIKYVF